MSLFVTDVVIRWLTVKLAMVVVLSSGSELLMTGGPEFVSDLVAGDLPSC
jgi:hypothetical protein